MVRFFLFLLFFSFQVLVQNSVAAVYYVDNMKGADSNDGLSVETAWKTIGKVNRKKFMPGDQILFRRGGVWEETLEISSSGEKNNPIIFSVYGQGANPKIKSSNRFTNWKLLRQSSGTYLWKGRIRGVRNCWGALLNGNRIPKYREYKVKDFPYSAPDNIRSMRINVFFSPLNSDVFFLRTGSQVLPDTEIGVREYGIVVRGQEWVVLKKIELYGPGGKQGTGGSKYSYQLLIDNSHNITIQDCVFRLHHRHGVMVTNQASKISIENVLSKGHGNTGIYFWDAGADNRIIDSRVSACGTVVSDKGDLGGIGVWSTTAVTIENSQVEGNGHPEMGTVDAAISFVQSPFGKIKNCLIKNSGGTGIQFAANSDNGLASYNVIDGWGVHSPENSSEGIRIGGGLASTGAEGCHIYNNLLANGICDGGDRAAIRVENRRNRGLQVINNIFYDNGNCQEIIGYSQSDFQDWEISHNYFYRKNPRPFKIGRKLMAFIPPEMGEDNIYTSEPPGLDLSNRCLLPDSPCINAGRPVGLSIDFNGLPLEGRRVDIGPFEYLD